MYSSPQLKSWTSLLHISHISPLKPTGFPQQHPRELQSQVYSSGSAKSANPISYSLCVFLHTGHIAICCISLLRRTFALRSAPFKKATSAHRWLSLSSVG